MRTVALVPVKRLEAAKSRLGPRLEANERRALALGLLRGVLAALRAAGVVAEQIVVSPDPRVLALAETLGAWALRQRDDGLNPALEAARAAAGTAEAVLVVAADLPLLTPAEVRGLVALAPAPPGVVIAPDAAEDGTNALLLRPAGLLPFGFGAGSLERHLASARAAGATVALYRSLGLAFDLDTPAQLDELRQREARRYRELVEPAALVGLTVGDGQ
jgi:2-phospho-L-lactate guanylyltransferase